MVTIKRKLTTVLSKTQQPKNKKKTIKKWFLANVQLPAHQCTFI